MSTPPEIRIRTPESYIHEPVARTAVENKLGVRFPGEVPFFGIIGEPGRYNLEKFKHIHSTDRYEFPEGTPSMNAQQAWNRLVQEALVAGKTLFSNEKDPNIALVEASVDDGKFKLKTKEITYKNYRVATEPEFAEDIASGELDPHLMLAQCQIIRGIRNGKPEVILTWRDPKKNEYKGDEFHLIGGHHKRSEGTIWKTYLNEQNDEGNIPEHTIKDMYITGLGWNRELQKPELLAVVDIDPIYDIGKYLAKGGRGVRTFSLPDDPKILTDFTLACFPQVVPVGAAGIYNHLILNHGDNGQKQAQRMADGMRDQIKYINGLDDRGFEAFLQNIISVKTDALHRAVDLPLFSAMNQDERNKTIELHRNSYEVLRRER